MLCNAAVAFLDKVHGLWTNADTMTTQYISMQSVKQLRCWWKKSRWMYPLWIPFFSPKYNPVLRGFYPLAIVGEVLIWLRRNLFIELYWICTWRTYTKEKLLILNECIEYELQVTYWYIHRDMYIVAKASLEFFLHSYTDTFITYYMYGKEDCKWSSKSQIIFHELG